MSAPQTVGPSPSAPLLVAQGIRRHYRPAGTWIFGGRQQTVLDGIDLTVERGDCVALMGVNGAGKSTLARLLIGLEAPSGGTVRYRGQDLATLPAADRARARRALQMVFQDSYGAVNPRLTVAAALAEPLANAGVPQGEDRGARLEALLAAVGLDPAVVHRPAHSLSGGQIQRLCLARAMATDPELIILDESLSALDMLVQAEILSLLEGLRAKTGVAIVLITHDMRVARRIADRAVVLDQGQVVEVIDAPGQLGTSLAPTASNRHAAHHPATQRLIDAVLPPWPRRRGGPDRPLCRGAPS